MTETTQATIRVRDKRARNQLVRVPGLAVIRLDTGQHEMVGADGLFPDERPADHVG